MKPKNTAQADACYKTAEERKYSVILLMFVPLTRRFASTSPTRGEVVLIYTECERRRPLPLIK